MGILARHLLGRFLVYTGGALFVLSLAVIVGELLLGFDDIGEATGGLGEAVLYLLLKLPADYLPILVPTSVFAGAFASLGLAARHHEILAAKAGGISPTALAVPLLAAAAFLSVASFAAVETVGVRAARVWRHQFRGDAGEIAFRKGSFWYHRGPFVFNVSNADPRSRILHDVRIFELDADGRLLRSIRAGAAKIAEDGSWILRDAVIRRFDPDHPRRAPVYERRAEVTFSAAHRADLALLEADPTALSLGDLREYIEARSEFHGAQLTRFRAVLHQRLADLPIPLLFALLAVPFALRVETTRSFAMPTLEGVGATTAFWLARSVGQAVATGGAASPAVVPWLAVGAFAAAGLLALARIPR